MMPGSSRSGFTLLELAVAIFLVLLLMAAALPSLLGQAARQRLQLAYDRFDSLVADAQRHSVTDGKPYILTWAPSGAIRLYPADWNPADKKATAAASLVPANEDDHYTLVRDASLTAAPAPVWTFWPSGNCEPVSVRFEGASGTWTAQYNALSTRGNITRFVAR
jgi:prepilin-type N-terminal cleavage/methylation domain-containing protein